MCGRGNTEFSGKYEDCELRSNCPLRAYGKMGINVSLKIHLLDAHVECFPENCGAFSDEHGEGFHQDMASMEIRFKGKNIARLLLSLIHI